MSHGSEAAQSDLDCRPRDGVDCYRSFLAATLTSTTLLCARDLALLGKHAFPPPGADHSMSLLTPWGLISLKPYVKRQKNDAADAEAICEAVGRPNVRFVETKTAHQQGCLTVHRSRHLFIRQHARRRAGQ
jgi:hypothetical protein